MKVLGNKGLGKVLKIFLIALFIIAIPTLIGLPFIMYHISNKMYSMVIVYPNGVLMLMIMYEVISLFKSLEDNNPFCYRNVGILKKCSIISFIMSILWVLDLIFMIFIIHNTYFNYMLVLVFLALLFFGASIALIILAELIKQATIYKEENDLTI